VQIDGDAARQREAELAPGQPLGPNWRATPGGLRFETDKPAATMAVIDGYGVTPDNQPDHGEITSALALRASGQGESNLLRVDTTGTPQISILSMLGTIDPNNFGATLDRSMAGIYAQQAATTTEALREIRLQHPSITTVSQSQGINGPSLTEALLNAAAGVPPFSAKLARELGLPESVDWTSPQAQLAVAQRVQGALSASPEAAQAQRNLGLEVQRSEGQFQYFNSAGNSGALQERLAAQGFQFDPQWSGNAPSGQPGVETVGAGRQIGPALAVPAPYSQTTAATISANGTTGVTMDGREVCSAVLPFLAPRLEGCLPYQGTSYAAPRAAGLFNADPIAFQRLRQHALPNLENGPELGAGMLLIR